MAANVFHALRHAVRGLIRDKGFAIVAMVSIALGVGANASIFSLVDQALLRLLPVREPNRIVLLEWNGRFIGDGWGSDQLMSYPLCQELQEDNAVFDGVFCRHPTSLVLAIGDEPRTVSAEIVSGTYFPTLGVQPALGRLIEESDNVQPGSHPVIVVSYDYWKNNLSGADDVVGRTAMVNNHPMTIIGVAAAGFHGMDFGEAPALWVPAMMKAQATPDWDRLLDRRTQWMHVFARLKPGVTEERAEAALQPWFKAMLQADTEREGFPAVTDEQRAEFLASNIAVLPGSRGKSLLRDRLDQPLTVLLAGTLLLLALACLNVANLFVARGSVRAREIATRMALGGSRLRIAGELMTDGALVALAGGLLGLIVAPAVTGALLSFLSPGIASVNLTAEPNMLVFAYAFLASLIAGCLAALAPALQAGRTPLVAPLKERSAVPGGTARLRKVLVVGQMAFTLILMIGAGLFVRTLESLREQGPGFSTSNLLSFAINPTQSGYSPEDSTRLIQRILDDLGDSPQIDRAAAAGVALLMGGSWNANVTIEADARVVSDRPVHCNRVSPGFFDTLGARLVAGRDFDDRDARPITPRNTDPYRTVIVNESLARRYFGSMNPIGRRLGFGDQPDAQTEIEIIGVVRDFSYRNLREQTEQAFFPMFGGYAQATAFYVRARGSSEAAMTVVREAVRNADPAIPLVGARTIEEQIDRSLLTERILAALSSGFGAVAILLSVVGLYGVMSFLVTTRTPEIGIRLALGSTSGGTLWLVLRDAFAMIGAGIAIALPCVWGLGRLVESRLFGIHAMDAPTIALACALLALVAAGAAALPARRAASISPVEALRSE